MSGFALLWGKILESSLWVTESKETRLVWITLLAMKNSDGCVYASMVGLADRAKVSLEECQKAIKVLSSPDRNDTSGVEEGRRVRPIDGGWQVINHDRYRFSTEAKREFWKITKADQRRRAAEAEERKKRKKKKRPHLGKMEAHYLKREREGASQEELDRIAAGEV